jgi:uncharacterized membrane protein YgcG
VAYFSVWSVGAGDEWRNSRRTGAQANSGPAHGAAGKQPIARWIPTTTVILVIAGYIATAVVAVAVPANSQVPPAAGFGFFILAVVTFTLLVVLLVRVIGRLIAIARSTLPAERRRVRPWIVDAGLAVAVFLGSLWMTAVIDNGGFDQRCIDSGSMTVMAAADCEGTGGDSGATYVWYYGGTGTRIGDYVQGGSLTEPGTDGGGGSGGSGGSGGDDGGDGGSDGGDGG